MGLDASWEQRGRMTKLAAQWAELEKEGAAFFPGVTGHQHSSPQGTAKMLLQKGQHPAQLRTDVCTPGGTTIHGLHALEQGGLRAATMSAVEAATCRAKELSRK